MLCSEYRKKRYCCCPLWMLLMAFSRTFCVLRWWQKLQHLLKPSVFKIGGPQTQDLAIINYWPVQDAI